jgi:hypothetical protein
VLERLERLVLYPLREIESLEADLAVEEVSFEVGVLRFRVTNRGRLDVSDLGVVVVIDDRYTGHRYLRLPWLAAGEAERFELPLDLAPGPHDLLVWVDPEGEVIEPPTQRTNNLWRLNLVI